MCFEAYFSEKQTLGAKVPEGGHFFEKAVARGTFFSLPKLTVPPSLPGHLFKIVMNQCPQLQELCHASGDEARKILRLANRILPPGSPLPSTRPPLLTYIFFSDENESCP